MDITESLVNRFEEKVKVGRGCWEWMAFRNPTRPCEISGYGRFQIGKRGYLAHRVSWRIYRGEIPEGMCVMHKCDNPCCVNPKHLSIGTLSDNAVDKVEKGRANPACGEQQHNSKLKRHEVIEIRMFYEVGGFSQAELGDIYGVRRRTINGIVRRQSWKHLE